MSWTVRHLWLIPALPLVAAGLTALLRQPRRKPAAALAILSMIAAFGLSLAAFVETLGHAAQPGVWRQVVNFPWLEMGAETLRLGWMLDPLTAAMLVMVSFVSLLIFIYSVGYMAHDVNFTRFFCFLALFASAMLGLVIANSLLLFFICWEVVGFASYILISFWYHKPSAAAAGKKAFITTKLGDLGFFLGLVWLYSKTGTLLMYDGGHGCLERAALQSLTAQITTLGVLPATAIALLIFSGAVGKSGQVPLHVWLPDAMEGPTPVSALIHAATMVAAGVFLVARVYPLMEANPANVEGLSAALQVVAWVGAITAVFAACIAVAQSDIKRILAYSTVSQLGFMMLGLGVGGVVVGMFHLITHAFFKALLFLGAGSVIHGCHEEQDIHRMGGLRRFMPVTFVTYAVGMMALAGVPVFFAGFWSKDDILHAAHRWPVSHLPYYLGLLGAFLTAFYMTRQISYVFFGPYRGEAMETSHAPHHPHESPGVMTAPLACLAFFAMALGFVGTPAWPWFQSYLTGQTASFELGRLFEADVLWLLLSSSLIVFAGIALGWWLYGRRLPAHAGELDALERLFPDVFDVLRKKLLVDEFYGATVVRLNGWWAGWCDALDRWLWGGAVQAAGYLVLGLSWINRLLDEYVVNLGFDEGCRRLRHSGGWAAGLQDGQVHNYLRVIGVALTALLLLLTWGCNS